MLKNLNIKIENAEVGEGAWADLKEIKSFFKNNLTATVRDFWRVEALRNYDEAQIYFVLFEIWWGDGRLRQIPRTHTNTRLLRILQPFSILPLEDYVASIEISATQMLADEVLAEESGEAHGGGGTSSKMAIGVDAVAMRDFMTVYVEPTLPQ